MRDELDRLAMRFLLAVSLILLCCFAYQTMRHQAAVVELEVSLEARAEATAEVAALEAELAILEARLAVLEVEVARLEVLEASIRARVPGWLPGPQSDARGPTARIASVGQPSVVLPAAAGVGLEARLEDLVAVVDLLPTSWPIPGGRVTSGYGLRQDPMGGPDEVWHGGIDIAARRGTPVQAAGPGRVVYAGWLKAYGNTVIIDHGRGVQSLYGHLDKCRVQSGAWVTRGQGIGSVGSTGRSTGPHLHFEIRIGQESANPWDWLQGVP
ncbi:MAG: peptidoglycan DD-metalloendopeptidase family protein [bacterium]|nr:peptidoglycan DD-metalloendopeptidase family protein [bacterium]